jgi:uncharacterized membrane protein YjjB (DUF3815 family)
VDVDWTHLIFAFFATIAYGVLFNVPPRTLIGGGLIGMSGWFVVSLAISVGLAEIPAVLIAGFCVATVSQWLARLRKLPSTNFSIPGIIPLVPGAMAYRTMRSFVDGDYVAGLALATETLLSAGAIAAGLMFSLSMFALTKGIGLRDGVRRI